MRRQVGAAMPHPAILVQTQRVATAMQRRRSRVVETTMHDNKTLRASKLVELADQVDVRRRTSRVDSRRRGAMKIAVRCSGAKSRDGRATDDAPLMKGASAGAATSPRIGKQVRLAHFAQAGRERA